MAHPHISIVIPAYNEAARIGATLDRVQKCIADRQWNAEVIVVDDGSSDGTVALVESRMVDDSTLRLIRNGANRGKGYSVRNGMLQASGEIVIFSDADLSSPMEEAERLIAAINAGADVAIGSRWLDRSRQTVRQPLYRQFFGRCFNLLTVWGMGLPYKDTQCGFKAFKREAAQVIFGLQSIDRWGFDPELLYIARKHGYRVVEVPVTWGHDERSRMSYLRDGFKMVEEVAAVRYNSLTGKYDRPRPAPREVTPIRTVPVQYVAAMRAEHGDNHGSRAA